MTKTRQVIEDMRAIRLDSDRPIAIIGAGIGGIVTAYTLQQAGFRNFTIYEKADGVGGTWRDNTYPGIACDVPSYLYSFTFAPNPDWSETFPQGHEICAYLNGVADRIDIRSRIRFGKEVIRSDYRDGGWRLQMADGEVVHADIVIACTGFLHVPSLPPIAGMENFQGAIFHSSRWRHDIDLADKRVANIGSGSSSSQIIPAIVDRVKTLKVFQRTAQWVLPLPSEPHSEDEKARYRANPELLMQVYDELLAEMERDLGGLGLGDAEITGQFRAACEANLASVRDPRLRALLTPNYEVHCKRLVMSSKLYDALQRPNCELVTTAISHFEKAGVRTMDGQLHAIDVAVLATGYQSKAYFRSMNPVGEDGATLDEAWKNGVSSFETVAMARFPNFFTIGGPLSALGNQSYITGAELQAGYILRLLKLLEEQGARAIVPRDEAEQRFRAENDAYAGKTVWLSGCKSWYLDEHGRFQFWTRHPDDYVALMRKGPQLSDYRLIN